MFLKNRNISSKIKRSKVTDYAALWVNVYFSVISFMMVMDVNFSVISFMMVIDVNFSVISFMMVMETQLNMEDGLKEIKDVISTVMKVQRYMNSQLEKAKGTVNIRIYHECEGRIE